MSDYPTPECWRTRVNRIADRVQLGIDYLRRSYGGATGLDWLSKVDVDRLNMVFCYDCVLAQVTGVGFADTPLVITFGFDYARRWGFYLSSSDLVGPELSYEDLTAEWRRRITELKRERAEALLARANAGVDDAWTEDVTDPDWAGSSGLDG